VDEDRQSDEAGDRDALKEPASAPALPLDADPERLPRSVRRSLDQCAEQWVNRCDGAADAADNPRAVPVPILLGRRRSWLPWTVAAVSLLLAVAGWWPRLVDLETESAASDFGQWRAQMARERMLAGTPGIGHWRWAGDAGGGAGDVVWDRHRQRGYLLLRGFVANDPARARYQLWIFDGARDDRYPVDGGTFDVPPGHQEVVIPVKATLPVVKPVAFAVTVEKPGGAVVSLREKLVAFAPAEG